MLAYNNITKILFAGRQAGRLRHRLAAAPCIITIKLNYDFILNKIKQGIGLMKDSRNEIAKYGITFGTALSIAISWSVNKSVLWAIFHGFLSWFYVIWHVVTR
jgi:hypothetical protein